MLQVPNPGDGFFAPPGGVRYVLTLDELLQLGNPPQRAVEQWMLARGGRFDVRSLGVEELLDVERPSPAPEFRARAWAVTMHTPWVVYTITAPGALGFWQAVEEGCRTVDRCLVESGRAHVMSAAAVPNSSDGAGGSTP